MTTLPPKFWNKYFKVYDVLNELIPYQLLVRDVVGALSIQGGESVLDLGSGTGNISVALERAGAHPTGIDISEHGVSLCKEKLPLCSFFVGDITERLPFDDASFDAVATNNVLYAIPPEKRASLMAEVFRVLKPGGKIAASNIAPGFKPFNIYMAHVRELYRTDGLLRTLSTVITFIPPTLKMFYYNALIKRTNASGGYAFINESEQESLLRAAGFEAVSKSVRVYAGHGVLTHAVKPL